MGRSGIIYSDVAKAAAKLAANGKNPTVDSIRESLGSTGSKSTIGPLLKRWKDENQDVIVSTETGLPSELLLAMKGVYEKLQADVNQQLETECEKHQVEMQKMFNQTRQLEADNLILSEVKAKLLVDIQQAKDNFTQLQVEHHLQSVNLVAIKSDNAGLEQRLADRAAEVVSLNQQQMQTRIQFEHYQESTASQRAEERQSFEQRIARLEHEISGYQQRIQELQMIAAQQDSEISQLRSENSRFQDGLKTTTNELASALIEKNQLDYQFKEVTASNVLLTGKSEALQQELNEFIVKIAVQKKQTELLADQIEVATSKEEKSDQERLALIKEVASLQAKIGHLATNRDV